MTKLRILGLTILAALMGAGSAVGASAYFWQHRTPTYYCYGTYPAAQCNYRGTPLKVFIDRKTGVSIFYGRNVIFGCYPYDTPFDCNDYR